MLSACICTSLATAHLLQRFFLAGSSHWKQNWNTPGLAVLKQQPRPFKVAATFLLDFVMQYHGAKYSSSKHTTSSSKQHQVNRPRLTCPSNQHSAAANHSPHRSNEAQAVWTAEAPAARIAGKPTSS
jgi:hypothetical protein